jgi:hypothetical protein
LAQIHKLRLWLENPEAKVSIGMFKQLSTTNLGNMHLFRETMLLFVLNILDAFLTLLWVRNNVAPEGNHLMNELLTVGDSAFIAAKIAMGLTTCTVLLLWGDYRIARYGVNVALAVYGFVMVVHVFTGMTAIGVI